MDPVSPLSEGFSQRPLPPLFWQEGQALQVYLLLSIYPLDETQDQQLKLFL